MTYYIMKRFSNIGERYLASNKEPYEWVVDPAQALEFSDPYDLARELKAQSIEVEDRWKSR